MFKFFLLICKILTFTFQGPKIDSPKKFQPKKSPVINQSSDRSEEDEEVNRIISTPSSFEIPSSSTPSLFSAKHRVADSGIQQVRSFTVGLIVRFYSILSSSLNISVKLPVIANFSISFHQKSFFWTMTTLLSVELPETINHHQVIAF